jgi:hypothetical protein
MWTVDRKFWLTPMDHSSPPEQIPNVKGSHPRFGPDGEIFFRREEGTSTMIYGVRADGTGMRKVLKYPVYLLDEVSRDGRWIVGWGPLPGDGPPAYQAFPTDGGLPVRISAYGTLRWSLDGRESFVAGYHIPLPPGEVLKRIPAGGFHSSAEIARLPGARRIDAENPVPGPAGVYAFYRSTVQRNLYRIPIL